MPAKSRRRKTQTAAYVGCRDWPTILRTIFATCDLCSRESHFCVKVQTYPNKVSNRKLGPKTMCARCRVSKAGFWGLLPNWQSDLEILCRNGRDPNFREWAEANPPLSDEELRELKS